MPDNTVFKVYNNQPVRNGSITVLNSMHDPVLYSPYPNLDYATQFSGQYTDFPQPKNPDDLMAVFSADDANLPTSNPAALVTRNNYELLAFDASTIESAFLDGVTPENYTGKDVQIRLLWTNETGVSGNVMWAADLMRLTGAANLYTDSYLPAVTGIESAPSVSGTPVETYLQLSDTHLGNLSKVEDYRVRIRRVASNAADTMLGDAYLLSASLEELY